MGSYTLEVREILKENEIFNFDYPIFDETYRSTLEENILNYYYFREIGVETIGRFIFNLKARLRLIMPYYNQMYESTLLEFDPLMNYQVKEVYTRNMVNSGTSNNNINSTNDGTDTNNADNKRLFSDTPQGRTTLTGSEHLTELTEEANNNTLVTNNTATGTNDTTSTDNGDETFNKTMEGNIGVQTYDALLRGFRQTFINVDKMIIDELHDLFMQVY